MVRLYERGSRSCEPAEIEPGTRDAITAHARAHSLGDVLANQVACCDTLSTRLNKPGLLSRLKGSADPDPEHRTVALFTARHLVVAVTRASTGTVCLSARLDGVSLAGHSELTGGLPGHLQVPQDSGVSVTASWSGLPERSSYYVALGDDAPGRSFLEALREAVAAAKQN
ncbi:hypothetical protein ACH4UV_16245 [Streptomyces sp. NPDC020802]|uniref:hypothetical protein n=1 Tax=Streptomyces sp. NPDC020802 TaxID=3365094 RepID=UPI0037A6B251